MTQTKTTLKSIGEFGLIKEISRLTRHSSSVIKGIGDDCAVLNWKKNHCLLLTTDMLRENVHFKSNTPPRLIGYKAMACSLSDIAAMGALPVAAVVSLGISPNKKIAFAKEVYRGMFSLAQKFHFNLVGGDTVRSDKLIINVTLIGKAERSRIVYRCGAKPGDMIFVSGPLGCSFPTQKHLTFMPRLEESQYLIKNYDPTSMIDISDGLVGDLGHIMEESRVGAKLFEPFIPRNERATLSEALYDGEDFELLLTLPRKSGVKLLHAKDKIGKSFFYIGDVTTQKDRLILVTTSGKIQHVKRTGYTHF